MNVIKSCVLLISVIIFAIACGNQAANTTSNNATVNTANSTVQIPAQSPAAKSEREVASDLYSVNCMTCHKDSGKGGPVTVDGKKLEPEDLTSEKMKKRSSEKLFANISDGAEEDGMPAFKDKLTSEQIKMLVEHLRSLQAK